MLSGNCVKIARASRLIIFRNCPPTAKLTAQCSGMINKSSIFRPPDTTNQVRFNTHDSPNTINTDLITSSKTKPVHRKLTSDELLEKMIAGLSTDIHQKNRVYKNDLLRVINKVKEMNFSTKKQGLLLMRCCAELLPDESLNSRMALLEEIWAAIKPHTTFNVDHYNELLRVYIANKQTVMPYDFINMMAPVQPDLTTYELIVNCLAEAGDLNQAMEVLSNMKSNKYPATESILNSLVLCQGMAGIPKNIEEVKSMMRSLKIEPTADTYTASSRALAVNKLKDNLLEELGKARLSGIQFEERHIMEIVKTLADVGTYELIPKVLKFLPEDTLNSPSISAYMQSVATHLVFQNHAIAALEIYKCLPLPSFGPMDDKGLHGRSLVRDCVKASMPSSIIILITQELMSSGRNPIAIENAAEAALQLAKVPLALDIFTKMKQLGMPLRCHYFWPIFLNNSKCYGEKGIMNTISTMISMDVTPDYETVMNYILPYVSFTSPQNLMKKFLESGLTVSLVLTPMMVTLLNSGQARAASEICELFQGKVDAEKLLKPLFKGYFSSLDMTSTMHVLQDMSVKASDKSKDWVGRFLCLLVKERRHKDSVQEFLMFVKAVKGAELKISTSAADYCLSHLPEQGDDKIKTYREALIEITDDQLIDEGDVFNQELPHPKHMNEEALHAHLIELEAKGMNTRGVLRKLLQEYCRSGNLGAAREILEKCQKEGVFLSAGMKAAIFDLHVKLGELDLADMTLADLTKSAPGFTLDEYKIIDFATLMVIRKRVDKAFELVKEQSKKRHIKGGPNISMNCWRLLDAIATHGTHLETKQMFDLLTSLRYCRPNNAFLGPLVRVHLKNDNLQEATNEFVRLANKYNKTPLKHELLCRILQHMSDGATEEHFVVNEKCNGRLNKLAQTVLQVDKKVHGAGDVQLTVIAALAEVGYKKTLRKVFLDPSMKFHPDALMRRCERFADEKKALALETIAECARDIRNVDVAEIYDLLLDVYQRNDEVQKALDLWTKMQEHDITPSKRFVRNLVSMSKMNNRDVPPECLALLDKEQEQIQHTV